MAKPNFAPYKALNKTQQRGKAELDKVNNMTLSEAKKALAKYAKVANQRLRELENVGLTNASSAYRWAEARAYDKVDFMDKSTHGEIKFNTKTKNRSLQDIKAELSQLNTFLYESKTSTVEGTKMRYEKTYNTFKERWTNENGSAPNISYDDFGYMWQMSNIERVLEMYGSKEVIRLVSKARTDNLSWQEIDQMFADAISGGWSLRFVNKTVDDMTEAHFRSVSELDIEDGLNFI